MIIWKVYISIEIDIETVWHDGLLTELADKMMHW